MELAKIVALVAFVCVVVISTGNARAQGDSRAHQKYLASLAAERLELKELEARERAAAINAADRKLDLRLRPVEFEKRCKIKAVMTDREIEDCRAALYSM